MTFRPIATSLLLLAVGVGPNALAQDDDPTVAPDALRQILDNSSGTRQGPQTTVGISEITISDEGAGKFEKVRFDRVTLARAAEALGEAANANVVVSRTIADQPITITLRGIDLPAALDAIAVSQGLVTRQDDASGVYFLATPDEIQRDLSAFRANETEVFTLLYPNATDVVRAIGDVFGNRVIVSEPDSEEDDTLDELENRFDRFDVLDGRSRGLSNTGSTSGSTSVRSVSSLRDRFDRGRDDNRSDNNRNRQVPRFDPDDFPELTAEEARAVQEALAGVADDRSQAQAEALARREALTYVTSIPRLNRIVVRSSDPQVLKDISELIKRVDVPTPLVLLEVRVLRIALDDGLESEFDFAFQSGDAQGAFSSGEIAPGGVDSILPGGSGANLSAGLFQIVSNNFQARIELLQSKGRVTSLATPILLTANGEVSRIFSGEQIPIVTGFTEPQVIVGDGATTSLPSSPITELRDVGTDLLITANINADRTVTLRLLQETSTVNENGATLLVPNISGLTSETIDTVISQSASGTIVAQDGKLLAFGGLIEETESDTREQLPVLGDLPMLGFLFRRESSLISRSELVVMVRPYVLSTPVEGDAISKNLLESLSIHPYRPGDGAANQDADDWGVFREGEPSFNRSLFDKFRFHTTPAVDEGQP
ncbi:MAG: hypothetical protein AAF711_04815 [Planctomycetota bacterium]